MTSHHGITLRRACSGAALVLALAAIGFVTGCRVKDPPKVADIQQQGMAHVGAPGVWASAPTTPGWAVR